MLLLSACHSHEHVVTVSMSFPWTCCYCQHVIPMNMLLLTC